METQKAVERIREGLRGVSELYNRLLLVVGPAGSGKSSALRALSSQEQRPLVNLGAELSRHLLDLTERQRVLQLPRLLEETVGAPDGGMAILDNTEVLFSPVLKQDPLRLLQAISRNRTVVASWLGLVDSGQLTYASPEHPEFRRYPANDLLIVAVQKAASNSAFVEGTQK